MVMTMVVIFVIPSEVVWLLLDPTIKSVIISQLSPEELNNQRICKLDPDVYFLDEDLFNHFLFTKALTIITM